jgi:UDP-N-acetylglucosamine 2-epimerase
MIVSYGSQESIDVTKDDSCYIAITVGTRPEIVKLAPVVHLLGALTRFLHTCQHRDKELSGVFLTGAGLPLPEMLSGICGEPRHVQVGVAGLGAEPGKYVLATIHRPENTDDPERLRTILDELSKLGLPVLLPLHPRTSPPSNDMGSPLRSTGCSRCLRPTAGRSWAWLGTRGSWCPTRVGCRRSARCIQ